MKKLLLCLTAVECLFFANLALANSDLQDCLSYSKNKNFVAAATSCKKACDLDKERACTGLGFLYINGEGVKQDNQQAKIYFEKACKLIDPIGCTQLGYLYYQEHDYQKSIIYVEKACSLKDGTGCMIAGGLYHMGRGVNKNLQTAKEYFGKGCAAGEPKSCTFFLKFGVDCNSASDCENQGEKIFGIFRGSTCKGALEYYERACDKYNSAKGCYDVATCYKFDKSIANQSKAKKYYSKACKKGHSPACVYLQMK